MDLRKSCTSPLPWIWTVEMLARSTQIDVSILLGLLEKTPQISDSIGRNAREVVSLKILERFLVAGTSGHSLSSPSGEKIRLDPSDSCEDVVRRIVPQEPPSSLKDACLELSKWDLQPFVHDKRSRLSKFSLLQLKEAILTGHSSLASLKEQSGLGIGNRSEIGAKMNGGSCNDTATRLDGGTNCNFLLNGDSPSKNLPSVSKKRTFASEKAGGSSCENHIPSVNQSTKKHNNGKRNGIEKAKGKAQEVFCISSDREGINEDGADEVMGPSEFPTDRHGEVLPHEEQAGMSIGNFDGADVQEHGVDLNNLEQTIPQNIQNVGDDERLNMSRDKDEFHDEETSIGTMKKAFLSSQCTYSQDSLATTDWGELNLCMKCSKGGNLLVCSSDSCPLVIHATCLGSDASYDQSGRFYCPFCAYSQAISNYMETKNMALVARKDLTAFICIGDQNITDERSRRSRTIKQNHPEPDDGLHRSNKVRRDDASEDVDPKKKKQLENEQAGHSNLRSGPRPVSKGKTIASIDRAAHSLDEDKQNDKVTSKVSRSLRFHWEQEMDERAQQKSPPGNTSPQVSKRNDAHENLAETRSKKQKMDLPLNQKQLSNSESVDSEQISSDESESSAASKYITRVRKSKMKTSFPRLTHMRRNKLRWTKAEENMLKKGVKLVSKPGDGTMPWAQILEFGADVFDKSRTQVDLKDKWRNLCKASWQ